MSISADTANIDIHIQFNFPAALSLVERRCMDQDGDGKLSKQEQAQYLNEVQARAEKLLRLTLGGQGAMLIPLADPVLDLQDASGVEAHPHELRLAYFARVPQTFGAGDTVALDSGLWADAPLMVSASTEGAAGSRFRTAGAQGLRPPSKSGEMFRIAEARCVLWERNKAK